jgi:hypothetical protein
MIVAPIPIGLLIPGSEPGKIIVFAVILLDPNTICLILPIVPLVIVIVSGVVISPNVLFLPLIVPAVLLGLNHGRQEEKDGTG